MCHVVCYFIAAFHILGCATFPYSGKEDGESFDVQVQPQVRGAILDEVASIALDGLAYLVDLEEEQYTAAYKIQQKDQVFYEKISTESPLDLRGMLFSSISVTRFYKEEEGDSPQKALEIEFESDFLDPKDQSIVFIKIKKLLINHSKAKIPYGTWYAPWGYGAEKDKAINIYMKIRILSTWVTRDGQVYKDQEIGSFSLLLEDITLDPEHPEYESRRQKWIGKRLEGHMTPVPRSYYRCQPMDQGLDNTGEFEDCYGKGLYSLEIDVIESFSQESILKMLSEHTPELLQSIAP